MPFLLPILPENHLQIATMNYSQDPAGAATFIPRQVASESRAPRATDDPAQPTLTIKDNDLFAIVDRAGDTTVKSGAVTGLFCRDTRFLSHSELQIEGRSPVLLGSRADTGSSLSIYSTNPPIDSRCDRDSLGIVRRIALRGALLERIEVTNYNPHAIRVGFSLQFDADFMDLFEVRSYSDRRSRGELLEARSHPKNGLILAYRGLDESLMTARIEFTPLPPTEIRDYTATWQLHIGSHETLSFGYRLYPEIDGRPASEVEAAANLDAAIAASQSDREAWERQIARIRTDRVDLNRAIEQAERDIFLLLQSFGEQKVLTAGVPWFSTLFGRDALIAASQTLMFDPAIARDTLIVLAKYQGSRDRDWHDEAPGKILHEMRFGEMARCREIPHTPYYGTVDATPLWLMLYADYYAWTGDRDTLDRLWLHAIAAIEWIDAECAETGYLAYERRSSGGIDNQGWKDSGDCIVDAKGKIVEGPIALCEVQAYVYAAKRQMSELARLRGETERGDRWQQEAEDLKQRFNRDFWVESRDYCALALDGDGRPVDSITSNPGHGLPLGIFTPEHADRVAARLLQPDLFNGWGIRTLSSQSPAYNPIGYHLGTIWPHDNALIAVGLRSRDRVESAFEVARGIFDMIQYQEDLRPPELFCGYDRQGDRAPVRYPVACSPQAWATGSIFQLLQTTLNPIPDAENNRLTLAKPMLPSWLQTLSVQHLKIGTSYVDVYLERVGSETACRVSRTQGDVRVAIEF